MPDPFDFLVVGGGAAGVFCALIAAEGNHRLKIGILEATDELLTKVRISGGGRCNITHHAFNPAELVKSYPRGCRELRGPFHAFAPDHMLAWLEQYGLTTHTEADGRIFPTTNDSATVVQLFLSRLKHHRIPTLYRHRVESIETRSGEFHLAVRKGQPLHARRVLLATGGSRQAWSLAQSLGHTLVPPVPSLFTFKIKDPRLLDLAGISVAHCTAELHVNRRKFIQDGPLLITHWGLSGPAVIKLSALAARELHDHGYEARLRLNLLPAESPESLRSSLQNRFRSHPKRTLANNPPPEIPKRFWSRLLQTLDIDPEKTGAGISNKDINRLQQDLQNGTYTVTGKGVFKEEFVTAGGVSLKEIDFTSMQSRIVPGLYFAGEVLDIDGITGGFNFQSAWTTAHLAARHIAQAI